MPKFVRQRTIENSDSVVITKNNKIKVTNVKTVNVLDSKGNLVRSDVYENNKYYPNNETNRSTVRKVLGVISKDRN